MLTVKYRTHDGGWRIVEAKSVEARPASGGDEARVVTATLADDSIEHTLVCRSANDGDPAVSAAKAYVENASGKTTQIIEPGR